jgi:3-oxoadipate enol-lactonase
VAGQASAGLPTPSVASIRVPRIATLRFAGGRCPMTANVVCVAHPAGLAARSRITQTGPMTDLHTRPAGGRTAGGIAFDDEGAGEPVVLVHSGVADRRMWDRLAPALAARHRVIRPDARGFGESLPPSGPWAHHTDLLALLDELLVGRAHLVGTSMGAGVAVEAALSRPDAVASLVLAAPGGALFAASPPELRPIWAAEVDALDRGDLDAAVEVNLRAWLDGPNRGPDAVDPDLRAFVGRMQREAFELPEWDAEAAPEHELSPPAAARLGELRCPVLVVVGEGDQPSVKETADRIASGVPGARLVVWPDVAHMLTMEREEAFAALVLEFLADIPRAPAPSSSPASAPAAPAGPPAPISPEAE